MAEDRQTLEEKITVNSINAEANLEKIAKELETVKNKITGTNVVLKKNTEGWEQLRRTVNYIAKDGSKVRAVLDGNDKVLKATISTTTKATTSFSKLYKTFSKFYLVWNLTARLRQGVVNSIKSAVDYNETVNKFNNAMGQENIEKATKFQRELANTWGTATDEMMNYQANFKNVMSSLGSITSSQAENISETLTKMGLDYSSLFNVDQSSAMSKIQSALTGQVKAIRTDSGYDITESTLNTTAQQIGITRTVSQMNEVEKRLLRIIALNNQLRSTNAFGDFARTIDQPAAQLRILKNQLQEAVMWIGQMLLHAISGVLPLIIGFAMALKEIAKALAYLFGYTPSTNGLDDIFADVDDSTVNISDNLGSSINKAKELKKTLMGFDVLNVISTPTEKNEKNNSLSIDPKILSAMSDYNSLLGDANKKVTDIRDNIMSWLGFTYDNEEGVWKLTDKWKALKGILIVIGSIAGLLLIPKLIKWLINLRKPVEAITKPLSSLTDGVKNLFKSIGKAVEIVAVLGGISLVIWSFIELIKAFSESGLELNEVLLLIGTVMLSVAGAFTIIAGASKLLNWKGIAGIVVTLGSLSLVLYTLSELLKTMSKNGIKLNDVIGVMTTIIVSIVALMGSIALLGPQMTIGLEPFLAVVAGISLILIVMEETLPKILKAVSNFITSIAPTLISIIKTIINGIEDVIYVIGIVLPPIIKSIGSIFNTIFTGISKIVDSVGNSVRKVLDGIRGIIKQIGDTIEQVANTILRFVYNIGPAIENSVNAIIRSIVKMVNLVISAVEYLINRIIDGVNKAKSVLNGIPGINIKSSSYLYIPRFYGYANGGFPDKGEMFVAREAGPELVGQIGNRTAVMNNNQIVEAVSRGVAQAVSQVMGNQGGSYQLYIDGTQITNVVQKRISRNNNIYGTV